MLALFFDSPLSILSSSLDICRNHSDPHNKNKKHSSLGLGSCLLIPISFVPHKIKNKNKIKNPTYKHLKLNHPFTVPTLKEFTNGYEPIGKDCATITLQESSFLTLLTKITKLRLFKVDLRKKKKKKKLTLASKD